ncbi:MULTISPECIES: TetR family transcriptional regulator [Sorangium]|uniref:TetR family transcriptional regulator n=1 Tax=Sorangium cellulosum TaxID=56 RepID=A0A4P2QHK0_SORCE|nr:MULTISPECIES: TetR family transcriptional regulator [Sorangium]AUX29335.1 TetR family transcriptional regulator [Sorangium cellulosum]WCQ88727.1 Putative mycofactocin biosynthesis transcriptional regulator MftR [Sorangium sp. Soce836]
MAEGQAPGLRERKKERTRAQIIETAIDLFLKHGYEQTTLDEVLGAVEISRRTFFRYFESKEDLLIAWMDQLIEVACASIRARPRSEAPVVATRNAIRDTVGRLYEGNVPRFVAVQQFVAKTPAIRARQSERLGHCAEAICEPLAARMGLDPQRDLAPRVLASCAIAIMQCAIDAWLARGATEDLLELVDEGFRALAREHERAR